uniref:Uncharacterized protein n=1 Tax=Arundo donax TaxID=35708 RepID=A0A0A8YZ20_ARUDO
MPEFSAPSRQQIYSLDLFLSCGIDGW